MAGSLRVTQVKSTISHVARNRATVRALGLRRIGDTVVVPDNDATRGMVRQVRFLVAVEEVAGEDRGTTRSKATRTATEDGDATPAARRGRRSAASEAPTAEEPASEAAEAGAEENA
jgi:large subunit ribosomal protein L30